MFSNARSFKYVTIFLALCLVSTVPSCLFVKAPEEKSANNDVELSPQPTIEMSDELVRSQAGDMIALLPNDWLYVDAKLEVSDDIIAVAVNPEYTLSVVFSRLPSGAAIKEAHEAEGLLGLARVAYNKHSRKTAGGTNLVGTYTRVELGTREFGLYAFNIGEGAMRTRCAVFSSTLGHFYEFALVPLNITARDIPADPDQEAIFNSVLATIQY